MLHKAKKLIVKFAFVCVLHRVTPLLQQCHGTVQTNHPLYQCLHCNTLDSSLVNPYGFAPQGLLLELSCVSQVNTSKGWLIHYKPDMAVPGTTAYIFCTRVVSVHDNMDQNCGTVFMLQVPG